MDTDQCLIHLIHIWHYCLNQSKLYQTVVAVFVAILYSHTINTNCHCQVLSTHTHQSDSISTIASTSKMIINPNNNNNNNTNTNSQLKKKLTGDYYDAMPSSFAILINLGLDGHRRNMYSSRWHNNPCKDQQIWDPFSAQCRQLYCKDHYEIKNFKCVNNDSADSSNETNNSDDSMPFIKFLDSSSKFVNVTLGFKLTNSVSEDWIDKNQILIIDRFERQFAQQLSAMRLYIDLNRLTNVTVQYLNPLAVEINFLIMDNTNGKKINNIVEAKNDDILENLSQKIVLKHEPYYIMNQTFIAATIHTTLAEITNFCLHDVDMPIWYWNSEFTIIDCENNHTCILVNQTGRIYYPGEYMGSVLVVESIGNSGQNQMKVSSNAVVCESTLINDDCPRIILNRTEYEFVDGRQLYSTYEPRIHFLKYELTDNQSVFVCLPKGKRHDFDSDLNWRIESILSTVLMLVSITLLILVLITYVRLDSLRGTINGFNSINLTGCLGIMQITFLVNQYIQQCRFTAVLFHYIILATIFWSSVIAYDMYRVFNTNNLIVRPNSNRIRLTYGAVAYMVPALIICVANLGDILHIVPIEGDYGPLWPSNVCWMRRREATILYFIVPVTITTVYNFVLYLRIICNIRSEINSFARSFKKIVTRIPSDNSTISIISSSNTTTTTTTTSGDSSTGQLFNQTSIYTRLSVPLGFTWIIALFSTVVPAHYQAVICIMHYLFIIANTSQGVTLFLAFGVYRKLFSATVE